MWNNWFFTSFVYSKCLFVVSNTTKLVFVVSVELLKEYYFLYFLNSVELRVFKKSKVDKNFHQSRKLDYIV